MTRSRCLLGAMLFFYCATALAQQSSAYMMLWVLTGLMFILAYIVERFLCRKRYRRMRHYAKRDPMALIREEYRRQAIDVLPDRINALDLGEPVTDDDQ